MPPATQKLSQASVTSACFRTTAPRCTFDHLAGTPLPSDEENEVGSSCVAIFSLTLERQVGLGVGCGFSVHGASASASKRRCIQQCAICVATHSVPYWLTD